MSKDRLDEAHREAQESVMTIISELIDRIYALKHTVITAILHIDRGYAGKAKEVLESGLRSEEE